MTQKTDQRVLARLALWAEQAHLGLPDLTHLRMARYVAGCRDRTIVDGARVGRPVSLSTWEQELSVLHVFFRYLVEQGVLLMNPVRGVHGRTSRILCGRGVFTVSEVEHVLAQLEGTDPYEQRERTLFGILYGAGLRLREALNLDLIDYDADSLIVCIRRGKGGKDRVVPIGSVMAHDLDEYLSSGRPHLAVRGGTPALFVNRYGGRLGASRVQQRLRQIQKQAGVFPVRGTHAFRHAFATHMLQGGADVRLIQAFLGHASLATTARYTHLELGDLRRALTRAHPRERRRR